ncbi:MAG TPA: hypothetical protein VMR76_02290 [Candidatus Saccharimonadia bacterium]|nr:hypothetical protein [Candidatus Saccharimonadia bacterium]
MLLISDKTLKWIENYLKNPSHSLILVSRSSKDCNEIANFVAQRLLKLKSLAELEKYPFFFKVTRDKQNIKADDIRALIKTLKLKTFGDQSIRRICVVYDAQLLNNASQSALLKSLEEPPLDTVIILATTSLKKIYKTIQSRSTILNITRPSLVEFKNEFKDSKNVESFYSYTSGSVNEFIDNISKYEDLNDNTYIKTVKKFLAAGKLERLLMQDDFCNKDVSYEEILSTLKQVVYLAMQNTLLEKSEKSFFWLKYLSVIQKTEDEFQAGVSKKLSFTNLCLHL